MTMRVSGVSPYDARLFDPNASIPPENSGSAVDLLPQVNDPKNPARVLFQRQSLLYIRQIYYQVSLGPNGETNGVGEDYRNYLQIGTSNITYRSDLENYGRMDYWALTAHGPVTATDGSTSEPSLPVLARMRSVSIEIVYQEPRVDERDEVIVIDVNRPTRDEPPGCTPHAARGETEAMRNSGMRSYRASRAARATGSLVNLYI